MKTCCFNGIQINPKYNLGFSPNDNLNTIAFLDVAHCKFIGKASAVLLQSVCTHGASPETLRDSDGTDLMLHHRGEIGERGKVMQLMCTVQSYLGTPVFPNFDEFSENFRKNRRFVLL